MNSSTIAIIACLAAAPAAAQETAAPDAGTVIVTGQRQLETEPDVAGRLWLTNRETPAIVDVVTQDHFQNQGVRTAIEAMNAAPGVTSGQLPGSTGAASMRGFHRAVNYLYDGVRMANSDVGIRNWDAWMFDRIEVIKGPASVTSGEGALAGAINFVPRRAKLGTTSGEVLASYGSSIPRDWRATSTCHWATHLQLAPPPHGRAPRVGSTTLTATASPPPARCSGSRATAHR